MTDTSGGICPDGRFTGSPLLEEVSLSCDEGVSTAVFDQKTLGWVTAGYFFLLGEREGAPWSEDIRLDWYQAESCGLYMRLDAAVEVGVDQESFRRGVNTTFTCADLDGAEVTIAAYIDDYRGALSDCVVWGPQATALVEGSAELTIEPTFALSPCIVLTEAPF